MNNNITEFGALNDGHICTKEIQAAIDACAEAGGGKVIVPEGIYITGTLWLRSGVELYLEKGAVLKGSTNMDDYNELDAYEQNFSSPDVEGWLGKHLIIALDCDDVAITGEGTIDGSGDFFFAKPTDASIYVWSYGYCYPKNMSLLRPGQLVCFIECNRVRAEGITLTNQPCWGLHFHGCDDVTVKGIKIDNPKCYPNTDGLDIDCCRRVTISDCVIHTGDDAIAIRGAERKLKNKPHPCEDVEVSNCIISSASSAVRIGVGNGIIRDVRMHNIEITAGAPAICVMSCYSGKFGVQIEDVAIKNVKAVNTTRPLLITEGIGVPIRNITLENFDVETYGFCEISATEDMCISNLTLKNWNVKLVKGPTPTAERDIALHGSVWFRAKNIDGVKIDNFRLCDADGCLSEWADGAFAFDNCAEERSGVEIVKC